MVWLTDPPWIRWSLAMVIALGALWAEFRGDGTVEHPFAVTAILPGDPIDASNVEMRPVPAGLLEQVDGFGRASRRFEPGEPLTPGGITTEGGVVAEGWWALQVPIPPGAAPGDTVQLVLVDTGTVVPGRVLAGPEDGTFPTGSGSVAVPPDQAAMAATAAAAGRVVVLVSAG